jgi:phosphoglycerate dehydrogenase-like enzyme
MSKPKGLFVIEPNWFDLIYAPQDRARLRPRVDFPDRAISPKEIRQNLHLLNDVELLFSGWWGTHLDQALLNAAPRLQAVFFGGGSVRDVVTDEFWDREIPLSTAAAANAVPVAEFTLAQIIFSLKRVWWHARELQRNRTYLAYDPEARRVPGAFQSTIGIVSLGLIGRRLREMLRVLDVRVLAFDPYVTGEEAEALGVELVSLEYLFEQCDVVTLHTPLLKETEGLVTGARIASMKAGATLINTSRGAIINEPEMIEVLRRRRDLFALLDVTVQEPLPADSPFFSLPNVFLTPHIAGSMDGECRRMGEYMIDEAERFLNGETLQWEITRESAAILA